jgi:multiple sugar transport system ATP-binding protein
VIYGIRPEHLDLVPDDIPGANAGHVTPVENTGMAEFVAIQTDTMRLHALFSDGRNLTRGGWIALRPMSGLSNLCDANSQARIAISADQKPTP